MMEYVAPEAAPPEALFEGEPLLRASAIWRVDGKIKNFAPMDELQVPVNIVSSSKSDSLMVELSSERPPVTVELRSFHALTKDGIPMTDVPDKTVSCMDQTTQQCTTKVSGGRLRIEFAPNPLKAPGMHVLEATYPTQENADVEEGINHYAVSWAIRSK